MNIIKKNILLKVYNIGILLYSLNYLYDYIVYDKLIEGYTFAIYGIVFFLSCIPLVVIFAFLKKGWELKITISMMFTYLIVSFLGKIPLFIVPILAFIYLGILVNRSLRKV